MLGNFASKTTPSTRHPPYSTVADPESDTGGLFMSDAATGFSVLALTQADRSN